MITQIETTTSRTPLTSAARISARLKPKLCRAVTGLAASETAASARNSEKLSESMWAASASRARLPVIRPPTA
jgi:hypothetical protein